MDNQKSNSLFIPLLLTAVTAIGLLFSTLGQKSTASPSLGTPSAEPTAIASAQPAPASSPEAAPAPESDEPKDIVILYTSDIHCGVNEGYGVVGLRQVRKTLEEQGIPTLLVDDGDATQGDILGTLTSGEAIIRLMNDLKYDIAIPGNHDFDYGVDQLMKFAQEAEFPYISCNISHDGNLMFEPYIIKEIGGKKIGFIGITTPETLISCNPINFQDENGNYVYDFLGKDGTGKTLFDTVQKYVDEVRNKGVDYVVVMSHLGNQEALAPFNFQTLIENTTGIDAILDGHSHDSDQVTMNNKEGKPVVRTACGTKLQAVGYMRISGKDGSFTCGIYSWNNTETVPALFGITNDLTAPLEEENKGVEEIQKQVIGHTGFDLVIYDPTEKNSSGLPLRIVRNRETNLADLVADALLYNTEADIAYMNGGGVRANIKAGDITYGDIINVSPFSNQICVSEVTGQQILDALEWGTSGYPGESGGFPQVAGMTYEIHPKIQSACSVSVDGKFSCAAGERRVQNVMVGDAPMDPNKKYRLAGSEFFLKNGGDGFTMFSKDDIVLDQIAIDNAALIKYIQEGMNGEVDEKYADPYGQGRIKIVEE